MDKLRNVLEENLPEDDFSDLKKPFYLILANLNEGKKEIRNVGPLYEYIIASCSVPVIFAPKLIDNINYVDGGLLCNLPASAIRDKCDILIGGHVNYPGNKETLEGVKAILERAVNLAITQNAKPEMKLCDYLFDPPQMQNFSLFDFNKTEEIIETGYRYSMEMIDSGKIPVDDIRER